MTERLYYTDARLADFDATVVARADDDRRIYLDRTAFYPTSGGQPHDTGTLGGVRVVDVVDEDDRVAHVLERPATLEGTVHGVVDWGRRHDLMQQHTGQHLLSALLHDLLGAPTVSVHFGAEHSTVDVAREDLAPDALAAVAARANAIVAERRPVEVTFEDAAGIEGLRKPSERTGVLRIVTIPGIDRNACGGTHLRDTGEIGPIMLLGTERVRRETRIGFRCGERVLRRARRDAALVAEASALLKAAPEELSAAVAHVAGEARAAASLLRRQSAELAALRAGHLLASAAPDADGIVRLQSVRQHTGDDLRRLAQALAERPRVRFIGVASDAPSLVVAASADAGWDAGAAVRALVAAQGARGGGSAGVAEARVAAMDATDAAVQFLSGAQSG